MSNEAPPPGSGEAFVFIPGPQVSPILCSFPHVGLEWPDRLGPRPQVNLRKNADLAVDTMGRDLPVASVRARYSRLVADLNRYEDDIDPAVCRTHPAPRPRADPGEPNAPHAHNVPHHRGVIWRQALGNVTILPRPLSLDAVEDRLEHYHRPYWRAVAALLETRRRRFGRALLLDIHSMPSSVRQDIVISTRRGRTVRPGEVDIALSALSTLPNLEIQVDDPYTGGAITSQFGRPGAGISALQIEFNRRLYLDEQRLQLLDDRSPIPRTAHARRGPSPAETRTALHTAISRLTTHLLNQCTA